MAFFERRYVAVQKLGDWAKKKLHHDLAVWLAGRVFNADQLDRAKFALLRATTENSGSCLSLVTGKAVVYEALGITKQSRRCKRCIELEKVLQRHGIPVP